MPQTSTPSLSKFKLSAKANVELELSDAFQLFTDTGKLERKARAAGAEVMRTAGQGIEAGSSWHLQANFRKKELDIALEILDSRRLEYVTSLFHSDTFTGQIELKFKAKSEGLTQVRLDLRLAPKTLSARLLLQGLRLTRHRQERRLKRALKKLCRYMEVQHATKP